MPAAKDPQRDTETFLLIDGHAVIYRAFHALPKTLASSTGVLTNAVYGFTRIVLKSIADFDPKYIAVAFDHKDKTFRHKQFVEYKANRPEMPDELKPQIDLVKEVVRALNIPMFEQSGFEADDLIGTLTLQSPAAGQKGGEVVENLVVTGDKDMFQLVDEHTQVFIPGRGKFSTDKQYDTAGVIAKMGVTPAQIIDLKALMGDPSDNIPGVRGIGPKTAVNLIQAFDGIEKLYQAIDELKATDKLESISTPQLAKKLSPAQQKLLKGATLAKLQANKEMAFLSKELARINRQVKLTLDLSACLVKGYDKEKVATLFEQLNFKSLVKMLPNDEFEGNVQEALF